MAKLGDIFLIPLGNGRVAIGQVAFKNNTPGPCLILVCGQTFSELSIPSGEELRKCVYSEPVILASSFDVLVDNGDWKTLANIPPMESLNLPAFRDAGFPFSFVVKSYDRRRRLAWPWEMFAPVRYSISPKWLEDVVKSYFGLGTWNVKHDKLLYKNIIPFGKSRGRQPSPELPTGHLVSAKILDKILPMSRGAKYEDPLNEALQARGFGSVTGGGTQMDHNNGVAWVGLDIELTNLEEALEFTRQKLHDLGAPPGSVLEYRVGEQKMTMTI